MRALYINLDRSPDRRVWMENQANRLGIPLERSAAIDGTCIPDEPSPALSRSAMGCFLSHRAVWQKIASGPDDYALVLEDDAHFSNELPRFLADPSWIPRDTDIVHLGRAQKYCQVRGKEKRTMGRALWRVVGENTGGCAYIISRCCAQRLYRDFTTIDKEFDQILFNGGRPDLMIYKLLPALCIQDKYTPEPRFDLLIDRPASQKEHANAWQKLPREAARVGRQVANALHLTSTRRVRVNYL
jgi:glycosyl transferase family 25